MRNDHSLASIFRTILASIPALSLTACACPETRVVVPIRIDQIPVDANASPSSRTLQPDECMALCGGRASACHIVEICTGTAAAACVTLGYTPDDAGITDAATDGGVVVTRSFGVECTVTNICIGGRRPEGFALDAIPRESIGAYLARQAALESASVPAFAALATSLDRLGAPHSLGERARAAANDEVHHAALLTALAAREGVAVPAFAMREQNEATLDALALDNAIEGCVRETFAALLALHQSEHARDADMRAAFASIADDETRHAELSRDVHVWVMSLLDATRRARVESAMRAAISRLRDECCDADAAPIERERLGLPATQQMRALIDGLDRAAWSFGTC